MYKIIAHLHQRLRLYIIGWMNLNVMYDRDLQLRLLRQKSLIKFTILFWLIESAWACWGHRHIIWHSDFNFARTFWVWKSYRQDCVCSLDHKRDRVTISKCLEMFQCNLDEFLRRFITVDETWIHYFTSQTKEQ